MLFVAAYSPVRAQSPGQLPGYTTVIKPGKYIVKLRPPNKGPVSCSITVVPYSKCMPPTGWWGTYDHEPRAVITGITFRIRNKTIIAPMSCYSDLADPDYATLQPVGKGYRLHMLGSDAAAGYDVTIDFNNTRVTKRTVEGDPIAGKDTEVTHYTPGPKYGP